MSDFLWGTWMLELKVVGDWKWLDENCYLRCSRTGELCGCGLWGCGLSRRGLCNKNRCVGGVAVMWWRSRCCCVDQTCRLTVRLCCRAAVRHSTRRSRTRPASSWKHITSCFDPVTHRNYTGVLQVWAAVLPRSEKEHSEPLCRAEWLSAASSASGNTLLMTHTPALEPGGPLQTDSYETDRWHTNRQTEQVCEWLSGYNSNWQLPLNISVFLLLMSPWIIFLSPHSLTWPSPDPHLVSLCFRISVELLCACVFDLFRHTLGFWKAAFCL